MRLRTTLVDGFVDQSCSFSSGKWVEPYLGDGQYAQGSFEESYGAKLAVPCP